LKSGAAKWFGKTDPLKNSVRNPTSQVVEFHWLPCSLCYLIIEKVIQ